MTVQCCIFLFTDNWRDWAQERLMTTMTVSFFFFGDTLTSQYRRRNSEHLILIRLRFELNPVAVKFVQVKPFSTFLGRIIRRAWHGITPPPFSSNFSNFPFTYLFSIKILYFFIISSLFPYFNLFIFVYNLMLAATFLTFRLHTSIYFQ